MKIKYLTLVALLFVCISAVGQVEKVQNKPYSDLRLFHFGVLVGTHLQDIELQNVGLQQITREDGTSYSSLVSVEQDRWDVGFQVGVLGELRLNTHLQLRVAPAMFFGTRNIRYLNVNEKNANGKYAVSLVAREDNKNSKKIQDLTKAMTSEKVKKFIEEKYAGQGFPVF